MKPIITLKQAKALKLTRYFTGKTCKRNHLCERYVSTASCVECQNEISSNWKKAHRESESRAKREWTAKNREKMRELKRHYYSTDARTRELQAARARRWMESNREKYRKSSAEWRLRNLHKAAAAQQRRRAKLLRCMPPWADHEKILQVYEMARDLSEKTGVKYNVDHIVPLQGDLVTGLHVEWNLQLLTESENKSKGARFPVGDDIEET